MDVFADLVCQLVVDQNIVCFIWPSWCTKDVWGGQWAKRISVLDSEAAQSKIIAGRKISVLSNDKQCFELTKSWMTVRLENGHEHERCLANEYQQLPSEVMDVGF